MKNKLKDNLVTIGEVLLLASCVAVIFIYGFNFIAGVIS